jgi:hypothetical protein
MGAWSCRSPAVCNCMACAWCLGALSCRSPALCEPDVRAASCRLCCWCCCQSALAPEHMRWLLTALAPWCRLCRWRCCSAPTSAAGAAPCTCTAVDCADCLVECFLHVDPHRHCPGYCVATNRVPHCMASAADTLCWLFPAVQVVRMLPNFGFAHAEDMHWRLAQASNRCAVNACNAGVLRPLHTSPC